MFNPLDCAAPHNGITCELLVIGLSYRNMVRYVRVLKRIASPPMCLMEHCPSSRFKLIIWPAESNSKQCGWESGWNWWNCYIWYAKCWQTCTQTHQCVCVQVHWHLFATLNTICKETRPELTQATSVISKCRKIRKTADRHCAVWYITLLNAL